jgi:hypothetical protein
MKNEQGKTESWKMTKNAHYTYGMPIHNERRLY